MCNGIPPPHDVLIVSDVGSAPWDDFRIRYDANDPFWPKAGAENKDMGGFGVRYIECPCKNMVCNTNCIARRAYDDGADYFFRSNDDTGFTSSNWLMTMVGVLKGLDPPNIGVVGPKCTVGNVMILTHDFVHRSHLEAMGMNYYPTVFENYFCDDWISLVRPSR